MIIGVKILPRKEVLDSQGRAVERTLTHYGHKLDQCRVGKYVQLEFATKDQAEALEKAKQIAEFVLYNPLIENYELEVVNK